jgi:hypothetical protein
LKQQFQTQEEEMKKLMSNLKKSSDQISIYTHETTPIEYSILSYKPLELSNSLIQQKNSSSSNNKTGKKCPVKNCDGKGNIKTGGYWHSAIKSCPNYKDENDLVNENKGETSNCETTEIRQESNKELVAKNAYLIQVKFNIL